MYDRAPPAYPTFRFRPYLSGALSELSGLMLCIYPTFLSAGAASDRLGFYGERCQIRTDDIQTHNLAF